ncbi:MAG: hypothetical protein AABY07_10955 [Nanoarchaeota archaeon]
MPPEEVTPLENEPVIPPVMPETNNVNELIEKARQQERDKLYAKIKKEEEAKKAAEEKVSNIETQLKELNAFKENAELEKLGEKERLEKRILQLQTQLQDAEVNHSQKEKAYSDRLKLYEVALYRTKRIKEVGLDNDFEDFVLGITEEEIDESLRRAKEKEEKFKEKYTLTPPTPRASAPANPATIPQGGVEIINLDTISSLEDLQKAKRALRLIP